jgi:hypothetical protein
MPRGVGTEDFAKQMTLIKHAGYQTVDLRTFIDFVRGKAVDLRPAVAADSRRASRPGQAPTASRKLHFNAVMFVDVRRIVDRPDPDYPHARVATMQDGGRWSLQLHSGGAKPDPLRSGADDYGPYYAYEMPGESFKGWQDRAPDIVWGHTSPITSPPTGRSPSPRLDAARTAPTTRDP